MPIIFKPFKGGNYFLSKWSGKATDDEMVESYKQFFDSGEWIPGMNELADISDCDFSDISLRALTNLAEYMQLVYGKHQIKSVNTAVYAPQKLQFGMAQFYESQTEESPESIKIFEDISDAKQWLLK